MHRTQIYFEESLFAELKSQANSLGLSLSAYIRNVLEKDLQERKGLSYWIFQIFQVCGKTVILTRNL